MSDSWERYELTDAGSLAPVFRGRGPGVYVLEFADGEFYVGKTTEPITRFAKHRRTWDDIAAIWVRDVPELELDQVERATIADRRRAGWKLRNIKHNPGHTQPSSMDDVMPVVEQHHWALGHAEYDIAQFVTAAIRTPPEPVKMMVSREGRTPLEDGWTVADAVLWDLAAVIEHGIPEAVLTEREYWTVSDYPSTAGGRLVTLNAGDMEVLYVPRQPWPGEPGPVHVAVLNVAAGSGLPEQVMGGWVERDLDHYRASGEIDQVVVPVGQVAEVLEDPLAVAALRRLILTLMRSGTATKFAGWHSAELARRAYEVIAEGAQGGQTDEGGHDGPPTGVPPSVTGAPRPSPSPAPPGSLRRRFEAAPRWWHAPS